MSIQYMENELGGIVVTPETLVGIKRFSQEQREALMKEDYLIYGLTGQSIKILKDSGRKFRSAWHKDYLDFEALVSMRSEVAINPNELFLPESNNRALAQQEEMVSKFSEELGRRVQGIKAIMGEAPDYAELTFQHLDATKKYLFGAKGNYNSARTKTLISGSLVADVGCFRAAHGLYVNYWPAGSGLGSVHAAPLVVPSVELQRRG